MATQKGTDTEHRTRRRRVDKSAAVRLVSSGETRGWKKVVVSTTDADMKRATGSTRADREGAFLRCRREVVVYSVHTRP